MSKHIIVFILTAFISIIAFIAGYAYKGGKCMMETQKILYEQQQKLTTKFKKELENFENSKNYNFPGNCLNKKSIKRYNEVIKKYND